MMIKELTMGENLKSPTMNKNSKPAINISSLPYQSEVMQFIEDKESQGINCAIFVDSETIASGGDDKAVKIWKWRIGKCIAKLLGHSHPIKSLCLLQKGQIIASGSISSNTSIKIWDISLGICLRTLMGHKDAITSILSIDDDLIASSSYD
jgi:WD40 repeat protein